MAVGPDTFPDMTAIAGVRIGTTCAGIKKPNRKDLVLFELSEQCRTAAVFTRNAFCAAPVTVAKQHLAETSPRYLLINTGNANAGTGEQGMMDALACCQGVAESTGTTLPQILPFSTGVIGEPLPVHTIVDGIPAAYDALSDDGWADAAEGIMTTDTRPKGASVSFEYEGATISVTGISKGSGMICPNMATMLAFVATDADVPQRLLQEVVSLASEYSFNRITVDGDTSTNDACVLVATGASNAPVIEKHNEALYGAFMSAVIDVFQTLAHAIVRDGEGATKFVTVTVDGGKSDEECLQVAYAIAHSPLTKTALFASDPNWGRILAVVGRAGLVDLDVSKINIYLDDVCIAKAGGVAASYTEEQGQAVMSQEEILIRVELNRGAASETVWTTDLSHDYVSINADYRS
ncbi:Glutamate N-acetyltransferase / N-acetylglutamate synthase [gamma proteobacterium IMCC2047]|nr:Glutamate N-acetyltransferase / N-acetylglutamate synthase [gamma proteobacterium IMCC2047]